MDFNLNIKAIIFIIALAVTGLLPAVSYSRENIDVVLVMDSSGSMKNTDPMSLRIQAAKLFISLLDKNDRAAVMSFSDRGYPVRFLTAVDSEGNKARLLRATDKISTRGAYTNLHDALSRGFEMLSAGGDAAGQTERSRVIVLMSDGMMDVGDPAEDRKLTDALNNDLLIKLKENNVKVYTIAFTEQSDRELLKNMAKQTGGFFNLALTDSEFHPIFTSIFEGLKSPEMLPILANGFLVDRSVEEVTIVATKGSPDTKIQLDAPDGISYSYKNKNGDIKWFVSNKFDMITIKDPAAGRWEILFSTGENNKAYIVTNLKLQTDFNQMYAMFGKPMDISIWLEKEGERIKEQELLDKVYINIELTNPGNEIAKMEPFERSEGVFRRRVAPFTEGDYRMKIVAKGMTFEREKVYVFSVAGIKEARQDIEAQRQEKELKEQEEEVKKKEEAAAVVKDKPVVDKVKGGISWKRFIMWFFAVNLVLGLIGFLYIMRKMLGKLLSPVKKLINL
ncbi:MAG: VWA domain-containing protein, partial [Nitrospirota bacterium]|nr:VWA domain-containing protein [Nitrospirota bacterium]